MDVFGQENAGFCNLFNTASSFLSLCLQRSLLILFARRSSMEDDISSLLLLLSFGSTRETLVLLCPERRPWACQPGLHDAGWRLFRKGLRNLQRARRPARARWRPLVVVGATDLRGSAGGREGPPWPSCLAGVWRDQGRPVRAMARPARASWCTHTASLSSHQPTAQTYHIRRP